MNPMRSPLSPTVDLMTMIGARSMKNPESYTPRTREVLRYLTQAYFWRVKAANLREAHGIPSALTMGDAEAYAALLRIVLRPEIADLVEEEVQRGVKG